SLHHYIITSLNRLTLLLLTLLLPILSMAQSQAPQSTRPKIGLVLSGGGAKGLAHVGVLKVLEEVGLQPDYITGTSMGSIIGGLYALGYSAADLEQLIRTQDWALVMSDRIALNEVLIEEKPFFKNAFLELPLENGAVKAPSGLIQGQQIELLLAELALPAYQIESFDELPIPFSCMAADVIKGEIVELDQGFLPDALRTSMAIPTVFTAIRRDSMVLVDGGLIRNFPVQEVVDMGADIVIGVYAGAINSAYEDIQSFSDILFQSGFLLSIKDYQKQLPLVDYYIEPDLAEESAADFQNFDSLMILGEIAARQQFDQFLKLADSINNLGPTPTLLELDPIDSLYVHVVEASGNHEISKQEILRFARPIAEAYATRADIREVVQSLYGTDLFSKVNYQLRRDGELNVLNLRVVEKTANLMRASVIYDSYNNAGALVALTARNKVLPSSRAMLIAKISDQYAANISLLKYIGRAQRSALYGEFGIQKNEIPIYDLGNVTSRYRITEFPLQLRWQRRLQNNTLVKLGTRTNWLFTSPITGVGTQVFDRVRYRSSSLYAGLEHNSLNRNVFPSKGTRFNFEAHWTFDDDFNFDLIDAAGPLPFETVAAEQYVRFHLNFESWVPLSLKSSLKINPFAGLVFNADNSFADFYLLGGPEVTTSRSLPFLGLDANELPARLAYGIAIGYQHFFTPDWMYSIDLNTVQATTPANLESTGEEEFFLGGAGFSLGYRSIIGPLKFTLMVPFGTQGELNDNLRSYFTFGYRF
ncbi:MAG: patatin-like phospholipase family protein, partial [Bacteroidota bacterium]